MTEANLNSGEPHQLQFCALGYLSQRPQHELSAERQILLIVTMTEAGEMSLLQNPEWKNIVQPLDHSYFSDIWADFDVRAKTDPEALFKQVTSLSVGPLIAYISGTSLWSRPELQSLSQSFIEISRSLNGGGGRLPNSNR